MLRIYFLKKKRFYLYQKNNLNVEVNTGDIIFFEYISLDRDLFYKYRIYGLCVGLKNNLLMSSCYLNSIVFGNQIYLLFFIFSPFVFNLKFFGLFRNLTSKIYSIVPNMKGINY